MKKFFSLLLALALCLGALTVTATAAEPVTYGPFVLTVTRGSAAYDSAKKILTLNYGGHYQVAMAKGVTTTDARIQVSGNTTADTYLTLNGVHIEALESPLVFSEYYTGADQDLSLEILGANVLTCTGSGAGIEKNYDSTTGLGVGELRIFGTGSLTATGSNGGAGIGGGNDGETTNIHISGGAITAIGGGGNVGGAGIGGGGTGDGTHITISGGTVIATSKKANYAGYAAAGIGGGGTGSGTDITITGGIVTATGGDGGPLGTYNAAPGIGSGAWMEGTTSVTITGGTVTATGGKGDDGLRLRDIGKLDSDTIIITGGNIIAFLQATPTNGAKPLKRVTAILEDSSGKHPANRVGWSLPEYPAYGMNGVSTSSDGRLFLWLPEGETLSYVALGQDVYAAAAPVEAGKSGTFRPVTGDVTYYIATEVVGYPKGGSSSAAASSLSWRATVRPMPRPIPP